MQLSHYGMKCAVAKHITMSFKQNKTKSTFGRLSRKESNCNDCIDDCAYGQISPYNWCFKFCSNDYRGLFTETKMCPYYKGI